MLPLQRFAVKTNALRLAANLFGHTVGVAVAGDVIAIELSV